MTLQNGKSQMADGQIERPSIALSIRQPWAWLIVNGYKDVENRTWPTHVRGPILIHAGKTMTRGDYDACDLFVSAISRIELPPFDSLERGGIVGVARLVDCVEESESPWFVGDYGFVFKEAKVLPFQSVKGALSFFKV
jgi:hypothetical protein